MNWDCRRKVSAWFVAFVISSATVSVLADAPNLAIGQEEYPQADAVILRWEQHWTLAPDGALHRRDHQWVKLLNRRPIGRYADRTIDYRDGEDEVVIHTAQTHLPDGQVQAVPDYGFNLGATEAVAGWPVFADWKQRIISFSGVQPGATLELDYEVITRSGVMPHLSAEVRLDGPDPIHERIVRVTTPQDANLLSEVRNGKPTEAPAADRAGKGVTKSWRFGPIAASRTEAHAPPWQQCCPTLRFTTCPDATQWTQGWLAHLDAVAEPDERIAAFAREAAKEKVALRDKVEALTAALAKRFNYLSARETWRCRSCRPANLVFAANYGNPLEAAGVCLTALRALEIPATAVVAVDLDAWSPDVPTDDAFAGIVLRVPDGDEELWLHPEHGVIANPGNWGRHVLLEPRGDRLESTVLAARGEERPSEISVVGKISIEQDGKATGEISLRLTGAFADQASLATADDQKKLIASIAKRLIDAGDAGEITVTSSDISQLGADGFAASAKIEAAELPSVDASRLLQLGDGPLLLKNITLPLAARDRAADVQLPGPIHEQVELRITYPKDWQVRALPQTLPETQGAWGRLAQRIEQEENSITVVREARLVQPRLPASEFAVIRDALNLLRADGYRTFVAGPKS